MAEDQDQSQKTEEPTQRRLDEARRKGQVATSREVNHAIMLAAGTLVVAAAAPTVVTGVAGALRPFLEQPHAIALGPGEITALLAGLLRQLAPPFLLVVLVFVAAALTAGMIQNGPMVSAEPLAPKLERVSPLAGAKRLFALRSLIEFAKGMVKIVLVGGVGVGLLWPARMRIVDATGLEAAGLLGLIQGLAVRLLLGVAALTFLIALVDVAYQRFEHRKQLRMSRRDLQEEFKQSEGDPQIKARLRSLRMERARRRMMAEVPGATVVVTNPTHVAVALRYDGQAMAAPLVVAKGVGTLAQRIRAVAEAHAVPIVENPPLARALEGAVEVGAPVPPAHYRAVAEVIGYVLRLKGGR